MTIDMQKTAIKLAKRMAMRSNDPNTKVGCSLYRGNTFLSAGYNKIPDSFPTEREGEWLETKYPYVIHSEMMAMLTSEYNLKNSEIVVTLFPCNECAKALAFSGVKRVYYIEDKYPDSDSVKAAKKIFDSFNIAYEKIEDANETK